MPNPKNSKALVKYQPRPQQLQGTGKKKKGKQAAQKQYIAAWLECLDNPFGHCRAHIPDDKTTPSGIVRSHDSFVERFHCKSDNTLLCSSGGWFFTPYPHDTLVSLGGLTPTSQVFTDLGTSSSEFIQTRRPRNLEAMIGNTYTGSAMVRCISFGIRVTYRGAADVSSGIIKAGVATLGKSPFSQVVSGRMSKLSMIDNSEMGTDELEAASHSVTEGRLGLGTFEAHWRPNGIPSYQSVTNRDADYVVDRDATPYKRVHGTRASTGEGELGLERGQNGLWVIVEGGPVGADYEVDVVYHWEVIPNVPDSITYDVEPSTYDVGALASALNHLAVVPVARSSSAPLSRTAPSAVAVMSKTPTWYPAIRKGAGMLAESAVKYGIPALMQML